MPYMHRTGVVWVAMFAVIALMFLHLPPMAAKQDSVLHTYSALVEVDALARQKFVEAIKGNRLVDGAIRGMMFELDPYSGYIAPDELPAFERRNRGEFDGIGIELGMRAGQITVIAPIEGSPAARAGVLAGDLLLSVSGRDLTDRSVVDVEEMLAGRAGTRVDIVVHHQGHDSPDKVSIVRGAVSIRNVRGFRRTPHGSWDHMIDPDAKIGYIRVSSFRGNTLRDFDGAVSELLNREVRALILDLRFNPGGLMKQGVDMVDRFVDEGLILSTVTRRQAVDEYRATPAAYDRGLELIVLVNGSSASSAEIVAGSLQARGRALLVGERTFGKGSVQHLIPLVGHHAAIKLTVAYYRLPDGRLIHRTDRNTNRIPAVGQHDNWGVIPDVEVVLTDAEVRAVQESRRALDTSPHESTVIPASTGAGASALDTSPDTIPGGRQQTREVMRDRQLDAALRIARQRLTTAQD